MKTTTAKQIKYQTKPKLNLQKLIYLTYVINWSQDSYRLSQDWHLLDCVHILNDTWLCYFSVYKIRAASVLHFFWGGCVCVWGGSRGEQLFIFFLAHAVTKKAFLGLANKLGKILEKIRWLQGWSNEP